MLHKVSQIFCLDLETVLEGECRFVAFDCVRLEAVGQRHG